VTLGGSVINCQTLQDAVAVKMANDILSRDDPTPYCADRIEQITSVLVRYGQRGVAETLANRLGQG
jgi:hypothetical protein